MDPASVRYFNPGAMYPGPSAKKFGSIGTQIIGGGHKIAVFDDPVKGAAAQFDLLRRNYIGLPLAQAIAKWSGGNSSPAYAAKIAKETGLQAGTPLSPELLSDPKTAVPLARAMANWEAGRTYPMNDAQWGQAHALAMGQPSTQVAGTSQTQPPTTGVETPMPTYKNVGGVVAPQEVERQQALAKALMVGGMDAGTPRHWSEALGNVLMSGVGMYKGKQAADAAAQGQAAGNKALGQLLMTGDASAAMANPYSANEALQYQQQQQILKQRADQAERLKRLEIDANRADPLYQARLNKLQAETAAMSRKPAALSVGQQALDRNFAKTYSEDIAGGAIADAVAQLGTLEAIANKLKTPGGSNVTGPVLGMVPESIRAYTNPESVDIQNQIANIVQRSLRPILGAQFTQQEGENLIKRAYNPQLSEEQNASRLIKLATVAKQMAQQKLAAAKYFEEKGTLEGFKGSANFSIADVENAVDAIDTAPSGAEPQGLMNAGAAFPSGRSAVPQPPPDAVNELKANPTPQMMQFFDATFGPGAAQRAINGR